MEREREREKEGERVNCEVICFFIVSLTSCIHDYTIIAQYYPATKMLHFTDCLKILTARIVG